jgi:hypothetical protein
MKLEGKISILINREYTTIEIEDEQANVRFATIKLTPKQLSACLSRQTSVLCELEVRGLDKIGKKHENQKFEFEIPSQVKYDRYKDGGTNRLWIYAQSLLKDGWLAENYFGSQDSFFERDGKKMARVTIRRWTEID